MRVESMVAQQAILAQAARQAQRPGAAARPAATHAPAAAPRSAPNAGAGLPSAIADRLAVLFADDPGLAEAVSAQLPAARQASARDIAAYAQGTSRHTGPRLIDTTG